MKIRAIDFVEIHVADMDRALHFYRDTLGMDVPIQGGSSEWKELGSQPVALALGHGPEPPGTVVLAFAVEDIDGALEELREKGVAVLSEVREHDVCHQAIVRAPDGNLLMLHRRKDGTAG